MKHVDTLIRLLEEHGGPGFEEEVAKIVESAMRTYTSKIERDTLGNLIATVEGQSSGRRPRVLLSAHMDEIALMVSLIDKGGFLRVAQTGGFDPRTLVGQEVVVHGKNKRWHGIIGSKPPHLQAPDEQKKAAPLEDLFIDLAMPEERVRSEIRVGDRVTLHRSVMPLLHHHYSGKSLDNRTSVAVILECLEALKKYHHQADVIAVASVQEEVGVRGATTVGYGQAPDVAIAIDVTFADMPGQASDFSYKIGKGPAIAKGPNIHPKVFQDLSEAAKANNIDYQLELSQGPTGTDGRAFQITREGIATGLVGIAIRYMHTSVETGSYQDIVDCGKVLAEYIAQLTWERVEDYSCY
ncbi:M20/M25/M40 family metallo-hydrolase [Alicyclobacillus tolerans]|nr:MULTISPECIES: M20/M25/M40 family metallo-hydrolase [Alicyclobacillus]QRF24671.1 M42 family metallopeptidase [Alicyclobacillus sp. TC]SHJ85812.1 endoglucanase [Alicyclobacillus montanus]